MPMHQLDLYGTLYFKIKNTLLHTKFGMEKICRHQIWYRDTWKKHINYDMEKVGRHSKFPTEIVRR